MADVRDDTKSILCVRLESIAIDVIEFTKEQIKYVYTSQVDTMKAQRGDYECIFCRKKVCLKPYMQKRTHFCH